MIIIPRPRTQNTDSSLFRAVHKSVPRVWMEPRNVYIVHVGQHRRHVLHATTDAVQGTHGMETTFRFANAVPNQTKISRRREFHARHGRSLGWIQWTSLQQLAQAGSVTTGDCARVFSAQTAAHFDAVGKRSCFQTHFHHVWDVPTNATLDNVLYARDTRRNNRQGVRRTSSSRCRRWWRRRWGWRRGQRRI